MKKIILICSLFIAIVSQTNAQCPGALLDSACFTSRIGTGGGICRDSLTTGMANHAYTDDVSFVMPPSVNITTPITATVTLRRINITGISGLPLGLNWQCDNGTCIYLPSSGQQLGAIRFCGTPLTAGYYTLTVYISADVTVSGIGDRNGEAQTYTTHLRILPDTSGGNPTFTHTPAGNKFCDTTTLSYNATITSSNPVKYEWSFGNGNTSTLQNPSPQTYAPSLTNYDAILKTTLYAYRITSVRVISTNSSLWSGGFDLGEPFSFFNPDFVFANNTTGRATPEISDNKTPTWSGLRDTIAIGTDSINFTLTDIDGSLGVDPNDIVETGTFPVQLGTVNYIHGSNSLQITMDTIPGQIFYDTLKLTINPPLTEGITSTATDSFCTGDSTYISVNYPVAGYNIQWYKDSTIIPLATDSFIVVYTAGAYYASIQDINTLCSNGSTITNIYTFNSPPGAISIVNAGAGRIANSNFPGAGFTIEWYKDGVLIPGANSVTVQTSGDGAYSCHVYNTAFPLCGRTSSNFVISGLGEDITSMSNHISIYPNPSNGKFVLAFESMNTDNNASVIITDITGREVYTTAIEIAKGMNQFNMNTMNLSSGIYIVKINTAGTTIEKRLVISK